MQNAVPDIDLEMERTLARRNFAIIGPEAGPGFPAAGVQPGGPDAASSAAPCLRLLCETGEEPTRFAEEPLLVLRLFRFSATLGLAVQESTLAAALAAPGISALSGEQVRNELNNALTGRAPSALAPLLGCGALAPFGIPAPGGLPSLAALDAAPPGLLCRWWAFLRLAGAPLADAAEHLAFGGSFLADAARLDALFSAGPPQDRLALKRQLAGGVPLDYAELAAAFAALDPAFAPAAGLYAELLASGEPFRPEQLAVTEPGLLAEGVRAKRLHQTHLRLLDAVIEQPSLNQYPILAGLARQMQRYLR